MSSGAIVPSRDARHPAPDAAMEGKAGASPSIAEETDEPLTLQSRADRSN